MDILASLVGLLQTAVRLAPTVENSITVLQPIAQAIYDHVVNGVAITQAQLDALEALVDAAAAQIQQALPPDDGTTTT
jgi:hypothetical protein